MASRPRRPTDAVVDAAAIWRDENKEALVMKSVHILVLLVVMLAGYLLLGDTWGNIFRSTWWSILMTAIGGSGVVVAILLRLGMLKSGSTWGETPLGVLLLALALLAWGLGGLYPVLDWLTPMAFVLFAVGLWMEAKARKVRQRDAPADSE